MADDKDWSSNANEVLQVRLRNPKASTQQDVTFHPSFTYPIFGEQETIFGYRGLHIKLNFTADTLQPSLDVTSKATYPPQGDTKPDAVESPIREVIPGLNPSNSSTDADLDEERAFEPPGKLVKEYTVNGQSYGIWSTRLSDPRAKKLLRNMQVFVLFFIEGGTEIELEDPEWTIDRWTVFFVYTINSPSPEASIPTYSFVGYCTAYTLWHLHPDQQTLSPPPSQESDLKPDDTSLQHSIPSRSRISQFLILPPYQRGGHGSRLYDTVYSYFLQNPQTIEVPVEDPNESFDDMRDTCDLIHLRSNPAFTSIRLNTTQGILPRIKSDKLPTSKLLDPAITAPVREASKIIPRQFDRLVEMQLLSQIPLLNRNTNRLTRRDKASDENDRAYYLWRLLVKQRLYKHNRDGMIQMHVAERHEKLDETLNAVEKDYLRLLDGVDKRMRKIAEDRILEEDATPTTNGSSEPKMNGARGVKRRIIDDDDEDEDDSMSEVPKANGTTSKKARVQSEEL